MAEAMAPHVWQCTKRETNPVWQLVWILSEGPFEHSGEPVDLSGADRTIAAAEARWAKKEMEEVPGWALDGVHTSGSDERFAGTWAGLRNCVAMFAKYGRLSPEDEGVLIKAGVVVTRRRKGLWPAIVPSFTNPSVQYEIWPDGDEFYCTCPAYAWRSRRGDHTCKHVVEFLAKNPEVIGG